MRSNINSSREYSTMNLEQLLSYNNFTDSTKPRYSIIYSSVSSNIREKKQFPKKQKIFNFQTSLKLDGIRDSHFPFRTHIFLISFFFLPKSSRILFHLTLYHSKMEEGAHDKSNKLSYFSLSKFTDKLLHVSRRKRQL